MKRVCFLVAFLATAAAANASTITFAQFLQGVNGNLFEFENLTIGSSVVNNAGNPCGVGVASCGILQTTTVAHDQPNNLTLNTVASFTTTYHAPDSVPVFFNYSTVGGIYPVGLPLNNIPALMYLRLETTQSAGSGFGFDVQLFNLSGTMSFTAVTPDCSVPTYGCLSNLLTATTSLGELAGLVHTATPQMSGDNVNGTLAYSSDFLLFDGAHTNDFSITFSSATSYNCNNTGGVCVNNTANNFLHAFDGSGTGTFDSNPSPHFIGTPEPVEALLTGFGLLLIGFGLRKKRS